jgi:soluble lytic murein transglycosylase-like protein
MYYISAVKTIVLAIVLVAFLLSLSACKSLNVETNSDYRSMAYNDALDAGIDPQLFVNQINEESGFNPNAISPMGAEGIAQIMPSTAQGWGVNPLYAPDALQAAAQHMSWYQNHYGSFEKALVCYNAGCPTLEWAMANCLNFYWCVPAETRHYIDIIMGYQGGLI